MMVNSSYGGTRRGGEGGMDLVRGLPFLCFQDN